ncbi:Permease of the drug/metabolite transporter (DMT) superfamily [Desulfosporosinus sp. I2]|nr:Permease of the drug/metabolite transporter (DMT) superfamily [Desulfosporosinus sp. I2]
MIDMSKIETKDLKIGGYLVLLLSSLLYGGNVVAARFISGDIPPITLAVLRGLFGLLVLFPLARRSLRQSPMLNRQDLLRFALMGFLGITVAYASFLWSIQYSSATIVSIISATNPAITITLLAFGWKVIPSKLRASGIALSFLGLLVVIAQGSFARLISLNLSTSDLVMLLNVLAVSLFTIIGQGVMTKFSPIVTSVYSLLFGTIFLLPYGIWEAVYKSWNFTGSSMLVLLYMGCVVTGIAVLLNFEGISRLGSGKAAIFGNISPVFGILFACIFLGERLELYHWAGFTLVLAGIGLCLWPSSAKKTSQILHIEVTER